MKKLQQWHHYGNLRCHTCFSGFHQKLGAIERVHWKIRKIERELTSAKTRL